MNIHLGENILVYLKSWLLVSTSADKSTFELKCLPQRSSVLINHTGIWRHGRRVGSYLRTVFSLLDI